MLTPMTTSTSSRLLPPSRLVRAGAALAACAMLAAPASAGQSIPVGNPGFESPTFALCGFGPTDVWLEGNGGTWRPGMNQCPHNGYPNGIPQGSQIGFANSSGLSQVLATVLAPNTTYRLTVEVGRRADCCQMVSYSARVLANGMVIAEDAGELSPTPGTFQTSVSCGTIGATHPALGMPLQIVLSVVGGGQANFDDVRLDALPVGSECAVVGVLGDIDGDGTVGGGDLGLMLGAWGPCGNCASCPADLNGDCTVDGSDLGLLLGGWE